MGEAIGQVVAFGVGVSLSPLAIIAVTLVFGQPRGPVIAASFIGGWALGLTVEGTAALLLADGADASEAGGPATWASIAKLLLGVLLLVYAGRQWRERPRDAEPKLPGWMHKVETFTPTRAAAVGAVFAAVKPKNLLLTIAAATAIAATGVSAGAQASALAVFVLIGTIGPAIPMAIHLATGDRAEEVLAATSAWMERENATIIMVLCLVIGAKLIGDAISALS